MEPTTFFEHYRICTGEAGREVSRTGAAINYKAIDSSSHEPVRLQLIPKSTIEPEKLAQLKERAETAEKLDHVNIAKTLAVGIENDYFALVSEYFEGETADTWIVENGPMAADAALRVGLQVVRALGAAAYFNLTHRAVQPSNLMIVPGESPSGGWPFIKLLNFGLAGLELHSDSNDAPEIAPSILAQFASPEQRAGGEINFESEMYSLGATICFLLTGAAPLAVTGMKARLRIRRLPELRRAPKPLHNLLVSLLRENPENRPHDPVALEKEMCDCLTKIERRQAIGRKLGLPLAAVVARKTKPKDPVSPLAQVLRGFAAVVVLLIAGAAAAEYYFHDKIPYLRRTEKIGVPIGVPDAPKFASTPGAAPVAADRPKESPPPPVIADANQKPGDKETEAANADETPTPASVASNQTASVTKPSEPASPATGPDDQQSATENAEQSSSTESSESATTTKKRSVAPSARSPSESSRMARSYPNSESYDRSPSYQGRGHARIIGRTPDGRPIVKLTSGRVVILPRHYDDNGMYPSRPRRRIYNDRPGDDYVPPSQPFNPQYDPND
ncbi:MAG TPA: protein kinase [Chthoniobacterales bacterium]|nr:protein kinase [Chthoniobacterales bacterium]